MSTTISFTLPFICAVFFGVLTVILTIVTFFRKNDNENRDKVKIIISILSAIFSLALAFIIDIPTPEIYPKNNISLKYKSDTEITIESRSKYFFETYYTLDGSDPENGVKYNKKIKISQSTTVLAKNKFLCFWSDYEKEDYQFEKITLDDDNVSSVQTSKPKYESTTTPFPVNSPKKKKSTPKPTKKMKTTKKAVSKHTKKPKLTPQPTKKPKLTTISKGLNPTEARKLMTHINYYRKKDGISTLKWNSDLEKKSQKLAAAIAKGKSINGTYSFLIIGRQCNGAKNAQKAVSDWITGNAYIPSESDDLLDEEFSQIGGALYYLPNGNKYNYHYFWIVCLK